jgi:hypothetical protein
MLPIGQSVIWVSPDHLKLLESVDQGCKGLAGNIAQPKVAAEESPIKDALCTPSIVSRGAGLA